MKKLYQIIIIILLLAFGYWLLLYSDLAIEPILFYLILINIAAYIIRTIIIRSVNSALKGKTLRYIINFIVNIIWIGILFMLLFNVAPDFSVAIISFLIVAISLTFRERIDNIVSGILILTAEDFEVSDMVDINEVQGIVEDITLNYTKMKDFDGITIFLSNINVYQSATKKFTNQEVSDEKDPEIIEQDTFRITKLVTKVGNILAKGEKVTRYLNILDITPDIDPEQLENILDSVFDKYESILGYRPFFYVNYTHLDRVNITIQILSKSPNKIIFFVNAFLRDLAFKLHSEKIYRDWNPEKAKNKEILKMLEEIE